MALQHTYHNVEDIPSGMESAYTKTEEGTYTLGQVEGMVTKGRLDEFRENNVGLRKELEDYQGKISESAQAMADMKAQMEALENKYSGIDLDEWKTLQSEKDAIAKKEMIDAGKVDELISQRANEILEAKAKEIESIRGEHGQTVEGLQAKLATYDTQLNKMLVDNEITKMAADMSVRATAIDDVLSRGRDLFRAEDGAAVAYDQSGLKMYGEDAVTPLSIRGWMGNLMETAPHLFEQSGGAGTPAPASNVAPTPATTSGTDAILAGLAALR